MNALIEMCFDMAILGALIQIYWGVLQEWNLFTMMNAIFLFGYSGGVSLADLKALPVSLLLFLLVAEVVIPVLGNCRSKYVSFLMAMRYYAGDLPLALL